MIKKRRIGNIMAMVMCILLIAFSVTLTVQNFVIKKEQNDNGSLSTSTALDDSFYAGLIASDAVDINEYIFDYNEDGTEAKIIGLNFTGTWIPTPSNNASPNTGRVLKIPETVQYTINGQESSIPVTAVDLTSWYNGTADSEFNRKASIIACIQAVIIPKSVKTIAEGSFWGFSSLVYFESPFIGTKRGSSALGSGNSKPLMTMFKNVYSGVNGFNTLSGYETTESIGQSNVRTYPLSTEPTITPMTTSWSESENLQTGTVAFEVPGSLKKVKITDETAIGIRALNNLGEQLSNGSVVTGYRGVENIEIEIKPGSSVPIQPYAFADCYNLRKITLPTKNITLSTGILSSCYNLEELVLPANITSIPKDSFANCRSLTKVTLPTSIENIENGAFSGCTILEKMDIYANTPETIINTGRTFNLPTSLKFVDTDAFSECTKIKELIFPNSVQFIGESALKSCVGLEYLSVPFVGCHRGGQHLIMSGNQVCNANNNAYHSLFGYIFGQNASITGTYSASQGFNSNSPEQTITFQIPSSLTTLIISDDTSISYGALHSLTSVESITIGGSASINEQILKDNIKLKELSITSIPSNLSNLFAVGTLGGNLFDSNNRLPVSLKNIVINNSPIVKSGTFYNCQEIQSVEITANTTYIEEQIFHNNPKLKSLKLPFTGCQNGEVFSHWEGNHYYYYWWRDAALRNSTSWLFSPTQYNGSYPNRTLGNENYYAGYMRYIPTSLESVEITNESTIGYYSFVNFSSLKKIAISNAPGSIAGGCMSGCYNVEELSLPYIGYNLNGNGDSGYTHTLGFVFGESSFTNTYRVNQFRSYYIPNSLKYVTIQNTLTSITNRAFADMKSLEVFRTNGSVTMLNDYAFYNCENLHTFDVPNASFSHVGSYAFYNCQKVRDIDEFTTEATTTIGAYAFASTAIADVDLTKYTSVGNYAFSGCLNISAINIPNGVTIGEGVFQGCAYLTNVTLIQKVLTKNLFKNCVSLAEINLLGITLIPEGVFSGCSSLQSSGLTLDTAVSEIGPYAFYNCASLSVFNVSNNTISIGSYAFGGCKGLENMTIPRETTTIASNGWVGCDPNFYFYVYREEVDWPATWVDNWNCDFPVYVIGSVDENAFTYSYSIEYKGYFITGVNDNVSLSGIVTLPHRYQGLKVVGICLALL